MGKKFQRTNEKLRIKAIAMKDQNLFIFNIQRTLTNQQDEHPRLKIGREYKKAFHQMNKWPVNEKVLIYVHN